MYTGDITDVVLTPSTPVLALLLFVGSGDLESLSGDEQGDIVVDARFLSASLKDLSRITHSVCLMASHILPVTNVAVHSPCVEFGMCTCMACGPWLACTFTCTCMG